MRLTYLICTVLSCLITGAVCLASSEEGRPRITRIPYPGCRKEAPAHLAFKLLTDDFVKEGSALRGIISNLGKNLQDPWKGLYINAFELKEEMVTVITNPECEFSLPFMLWLLEKGQEHRYFSWKQVFEISEALMGHSGANDSLCASAFSLYGLASS